MSDVSDQLQRAEFNALKSTTGGGDLGVADRVYDKIPDEAQYPLIRIGDHHVIGDDDDCEQLSRVTSRIHVWSQAGGWPEAKLIAGAVRDRIRTANLSLSGFVIDEVKFEQAVALEDPDGISRHIVVEFTYLITHTS